MREMATQEQIDRLPKWARDEIRRLKMRVDEATVREAIGPENSNTFANPHNEHLGERAPTPLGRGTIVRYYPPEHDDRRRYFDVYVDQGGDLSVRTSHGLAIHPQSSNMFYVGLCE